MDIVERLRGYACVDKTGWSDMVLEAAAEIERLREQLADQIAGNKVMVENYERQIKQLKDRLGE